MYMTYIHVHRLFYKIYVPSNIHPCQVKCFQSTTSSGVSRVHQVMDAPRTQTTKRPCNVFMKQPYSILTQLDMDINNASTCGRRTRGSCKPLKETHIVNHPQWSPFSILQNIQCVLINLSSTRKCIFVCDFLISVSIINNYQCVE